MAKAKKSSKKVDKGTKDTATKTAPVTEVKEATDKKDALGKNQALTATGQIVTVRGADQRRTGYIGGNVGWQGAIRQLRQHMRLALHTVQIGCPDSLCKKFRAQLDKTEEYVRGERHTIPSDIVTDIERINDGELSPLEHDYSLALGHLTRLVRFVEDEKDKAALKKEIAAAKQSRKLAMSD